MTRTLDDMIAEAAKTGRLTAINIWPGNDGSWSCNVERRTLDGSKGWTCIRHVDPVEGTKMALMQAVKVQAIIDRPKVETKPASMDIFG